MRFININQFLQTKHHLFGSNLLGVGAVQLGFCGRLQLATAWNRGGQMSNNSCCGDC
jgi:hypothetical protein